MKCSRRRSETPPSNFADRGKRAGVVDATDQPLSPKGSTSETHPPADGLGHGSTLSDGCRRCGRRNLAERPHDMLDRRLLLTPLRRDMRLPRLA